MDRTSRLVYALFDPRTGHCRYIGLSTRGVYRPHTHTYRVPANDRTHRANWLRNLQADGLQPEIRIVEYVDTDEELSNAEVFWVAHFREMGCPLTNHRAGGLEGGRLDETTKQRIGNGNRGKRHSEATKTLISATKTGVKTGPQSSGWIAKRIASRASKPDEYRTATSEKISRALTGQTWSVERRNTASQQRKGRPAHNKGTPMSLEQREQMSRDRIGKKGNCSVCRAETHNKTTCPQQVKVQFG